MNYRSLKILGITLFTLVISLYLLFKLRPKQPHLTVIGAVLMGDGVGRHAPDLIEALEDSIEIGFKRGNGHFCLEGTPEKIRPILKNTQLPMGKVIFYDDCLGIGGASFKGVLHGLKNSHHIRIAYSVFESSRIPPEWVCTLNNYFDAVAVADKFLVDVYKNSGVTIPIFELPLGLNLTKFLEAPLKNQKNSPMLFTTLGSAIPRKNQLKLIRAFHQAFGNSKDVKLKLNSRFGDTHVIQEINDEIHKLKAENIEFTVMHLEEDLYFKTLQETDCYVSLSTGEGFSIQPRQAMALGIPTIVTDNTAQSTLCTSQLGRIVAASLPIPAFYPDFQDYFGSFYDCTLEEATQALKDIYSNYDHYLQQKAEARAWVQQYSYERLKPLYLSLINPKKIILGNSNKITPDCLFTDSQELCEKFNSLLGIPCNYLQPSNILQ